jgi:hypothetical protein
MTEELRTEGCADKPCLELNSKTGLIQIRGRSLPEDAFSFYQPVLEWLNEYAASPASQSEFIFNLEYFNTASAKQIYKILSIAAEICKKHKAVVKWYYDSGDMDMRSSGQRFSSLCAVPIELVENR